MFARTGTKKGYAGPQHYLLILLRTKEADLDLYFVVSQRLQLCRSHRQSPFTTSNSSTMILLSLWLDSLIDDFNFTEAFTRVG